jgi:FkbM family methyltransferase
MFIDFFGEVHYFDPLESFIKELSKKETNNTKAVFNYLGLSDVSEEKREIVWETEGNEPGEEILHPEGCNPFMKTVTGEDYMKENHIESIDFIKIDTEGHELPILKGFGDSLYKIKMIQFEYGPITIKCKIKLEDIINYLKQFNFTKFSYLCPVRLFVPVIDCNHDTFCNIVASK